MKLIICNELALMDDREGYFLNGNWIIDWSGRYESSSGGVALRYQRSGDSETVNSLSSTPLQHDLIVMVSFFFLSYLTAQFGRLW